MRFFSAQLPTAALRPGFRLRLRVLSAESSRFVNFDDITIAVPSDCNANAIPDRCDIADGTSADCNQNLLPDECELNNDCNSNAVPDACDIAAGTSQDQNDNAVPDECEARLDIKTTLCPNYFNPNSHGVLPVSLVGAAAFDVSQVDLSTVLLARADGVGGSVVPCEGPPGPQTVIEDVATPFVGATCDCHELAGDGITDLSIKFRTDDLVAALELDTLPAGALVELALSGTLLDGSEFVASDCIRLVPPGTGPGTLTVNSNLPQAWIDVAPLDEQLDGGGFGQFDRTYPVGTIVTFTAEEFYLGQRFVGWKFNGQFLSRDMTTDVTIQTETQTIDALFRRAGDITGDQAINPYDFTMFAICFGETWGDSQSACSNEALASSDLDRNGVIDLNDFAIFALHFGR